MIRYQGETVRIRASLGVASSEQCGLAWQRLMDHSDAALYQAKRDGRNQVVVAGVAELAAGEVGAVVVVEDRRRAENTE